MSLPFTPETPLERRIVEDERWIQGAKWGEPRPGHPEGSVEAHIRDVLANIDEVAVDQEDRERLRLIALVHDTFKHRVDARRPRTGENHHARRARRFAEDYIDDPEVLKVIQLHDDAYNAWARGNRTGEWDRAEARARRLAESLGASLDFYLRFYRADSRTGSKSQQPRQWFEQLVALPHRSGGPAL